MFNYKKVETRKYYLIKELYITKQEKVLINTQINKLQ